MNHGRFRAAATDLGAFIAHGLGCAKRVLRGRANENVPNPGQSLAV